MQHVGASRRYRCCRCAGAWSGPCSRPWSAGRSPARRRRRNSRRRRPWSARHRPARPWRIRHAAARPTCPSPCGWDVPMPPQCNPHPSNSFPCSFVPARPVAHMPRVARRVRRVPCRLSRVYPSVVARLAHARREGTAPPGARGREHGQARRRPRRDRAQAPLAARQPRGAGAGAGAGRGASPSTGTRSRAISTRPIARWPPTASPCACGAAAIAASRH